MIITFLLNVLCNKNSVFVQQPNAALLGKVIRVENSVWNGETRKLNFASLMQKVCHFHVYIYAYIYVYIIRQEIVHDLEKSKIQSRFCESPQHVPILIHASPEYISHSKIYFTVIISSIPRSFKWSVSSDSATKTLSLLFFFFFFFFFSLSLSLSLSLPLPLSVCLPHAC